MSPIIAQAAAPAPTTSSDWVGAATRPGSGLGLLPAAFSAQPAAFLATLGLAALAAALAPWLGRRLSPPR
ncbi:hypothetical protein [Rubellimicrobium arenae]|uniref:hypothetical protein n=1 Tax=Rubellimicrobium arenae TaxID=2817372 RepID=UPI001B30E347|nr:hypothetical protein [Rubellimicrobium arenae]